MGLYAAPAQADSVTVSGTLADGAAITGNSDTNTSSGNTVTGDKVSYDGSGSKGISITGGLYVDAADNANGNTVTLKNSKFEFGSYISGGSANNGKAQNNKVFMTNTQGQAMIYGGAAREEASGNQVEFDGGQAYQIEGGMAYEGDASNNTVNVKAGTSFQLLVGGVAVKTMGTASNNTVTLDQVTGKIFEVEAGSGAYGVAEQNHLIITDKFTGSIFKAYGGFGDMAAVKNTAVMGAGKVEYLYGGYSSAGAPIEGNTITINGGTVNRAYAGYAGSSYEEQVVKDNILTITQGTVGVGTGAYSGDGATTGNKVIMSGGQVDFSQVETNTDARYEKLPLNNLYGVYSAMGSASGNSVEMSGGRVAGNIYGGYGGGIGESVAIPEGYGFNSADNTVAISGGSAENSVYGGYTPQGNATGNSVTVSGGQLGSAAASEPILAAGWTNGGTAADNTVNITGGVLSSNLSLYGGYSTTESKNNTLNLSTKGNTVKNLGYFQNLNFYVPADTKAGETLLEVTDTADVHDAVIRAGVQDVTQLNPGQVINLLHNGNQALNTEGATYSMMDGQDIVTDAGFLQRKAFIKKQDANTIVLYVPTDSKPILNPDTQTIAQDRTSAVTTVSSGSDAAVTDGLAAALAAWAESHEAARLREDDHSIMSSLGDSAYMASPAGMSLRQGPVMAAASPLEAADAKTADVTLTAAEIAEREEREAEAKFAPYVMLGGHNLRYNSSSTVDTNGFNGELGFVKRVIKKDYADTIMPFMEYGTGNYTSYKNGRRGDGSQRYVGAGILLRRDQNSGLHYEGLIRAGRLNGDYSGIIAGIPAGYSTGANYFAAHLGLGKIFRQDDNDYNLYGKVFYSHLGGDTVRLNSDRGSAEYQLESTDSFWTRLGLRWTKHLDENTTSFYAGIGWDYEFDGKAKARYRDYTTPDASMKGSSEFLELGWQSKTSRENPWGADVRVTGWHGVKQGFTYSATITRRM